jgi:hypothetical protein
LIFLSTKVRTQAIIAVTLLIIYWIVMTKIAAPGFSTDDLTRKEVWPLTSIVLSLVHMFGDKQKSMTRKDTQHDTGNLYGAPRHTDRALA